MKDLKRAFKYNDWVVAKIKLKNMIKTCCADKNEGSVHEIAVNGYNKAITDVIEKIE